MPYCIRMRSTWWLACSSSIPPHHLHFSIIYQMSLTGPNWAGPMPHTQTDQPGPWGPNEDLQPPLTPFGPRINNSIWLVYTASHTQAISASLLCFPSLLPISKWRCLLQIINLLRTETQSVPCTDWCIHFPLLVSYVANKIMQSDTYISLMRFWCLSQIAQ